jgi:DNA polymerase III subunit gamma/tau
MTDQIPQEQVPYRVLARKYRPKNFADLIGQEAMVRTLTNAFSTGRVAQAYMLTGLRGTADRASPELSLWRNHRHAGTDGPM